MQTILGSGGAIGVELAKALRYYTDKVRLVSRNPQKVNESDELFAADLTNLEEVKRAVAGSTIVYLTAGFEYKLKVWQEQWPQVMQHVIEACKADGACLVFFDNMYMYDQQHLGHMTEETPVNPPSRKGAVRAQLQEMLLQEVNAGNLQAIIARSADFYGPGIDKTSMLNETVLKNLYKGKKANWLGSANYRHSFTYTPDAGKATALLGNRADAYNQIWHLPTASNPPTGKEWIEMAAKEIGVPANFQVVPKLLVQAMGFFMPFMKEMVEMMYQYDRDYIFDSSKFEQKFGMSPTPYAEGLMETISKDHSKQAKQLVS